MKILSSAPNVVFTEPFFKWSLISQDPDDNKFADLAISASADFLVTNDRHFEVLKEIPFPVVSVVSLKKFRKILKY